MFGSLGVPEILFILVLALLVFGPRRLPELGRTIGRAMGEFRRATTDLQRTLNNELALEDESPRRPAQRAVPPPVAPRRQVPNAEPADQGAMMPPVPRPAAGTAPRDSGSRDSETGPSETGDPKAEGDASRAGSGPASEPAGGSGEAERTAGDQPPVPAHSTEPR